MWSDVVQWQERLTLNQEVVGSTPTVAMKSGSSLMARRLFYTQFYAGSSPVCPTSLRAVEQSGCARRSGGPEIVGSNPTRPTNKPLSSNGQDVWFSARRFRFDSEQG